MKYRKVDKQDAERAIRQEQAAGTWQQAIQANWEARRFEILAELSDEGDQEQIQEQAAKLREQADSVRDDAVVQQKNSKLPKEYVDQVRAELLDQFLVNIENQHVRQGVQLKDSREDLKAVKAKKDGVTDLDLRVELGGEERDIEEQIEGLELSLDGLEQLHDELTEALDNIVPPEEDSPRPDDEQDQRNYQDAVEEQAGPDLQVIDGEVDDGAPVGAVGQPAELSVVEEDEDGTE